MVTYLWDADLVALLEELGVLLNEFLGWDILDGDALVVVDATQVQLQTHNQSVF